MTLNLDNASTVVALLVGLVTVTGGIFWMLRYIIRAETAELRTNGGSTMKDTVHRTATKTADIEKKLDEHIKESRGLIEQGGKDKASILERQDKQDEIIADLAKAVSVAALSTPPGGH